LLVVVLVVVMFIPWIKLTAWLKSNPASAERATRSARDGMRKSALDVSDLKFVRRVLTYATLTTLPKAAG